MTLPHFIRRFRGGIRLVPSLSPPFFNRRPRSSLLGIRQACRVSVEDGTSVELCGQVGHAIVNLLLYNITDVVSKDLS